MAARPARSTFSHKRTVRLMVDEDMTLDALSVVKSLPDFQGKITGVVPQFGGKCFDITLTDAESALRLAEAGFDYGDLRKPLRLLGPKYIHVSIFVSVEFPDEELLKILKDHGQLKTDALRRLFFNEEGFRHIERGIRVAEFVSITKDLPRKVVTQGLEIFFKYSGQPTTCYRCHSTEHVVKDCPKQRRARPFTSRTPEETRGDSPDEQSSTSMETQDSAVEEQTSEISESSSLSQETPRPTFAEITATPELFSEDSLSVDSRKRPPSSPAKDDPAAKKASHTTKQPTASAAHPLQSSDDNSPRESPFLKTFMRAIKKPGTERSRLMNAMSGPTYYKCRGLFLQYTHGNHSDADLKSLSVKNLNDKELDAWSACHRTLSIDAYGELLKICEELRRVNPALFGSK